MLGSQSPDLQFELRADIIEILIILLLKQHRELYGSHCNLCYGAFLQMNSMPSQHTSFMLTTLSSKILNISDVVVSPPFFPTFLSTCRWEFKKLATLSGWGYCQILFQFQFYIALMLAYGSNSVTYSTHCFQICNT